MSDKTVLRHVNDAVLGAGTLIPLTALLACIISFVTGKPTTFSAGGADVDLAITAFDLPLIIGLIFVYLNLTDFYWRIVAKVEKAASEELMSLLGVFYLLAMTILMFIPEALSLRFLLLAGLMVLTWHKNKAMREKLKDTPLGPLFVTWTERTRWAMISSAYGGLVFFLMFSKTVNARVLAFFVEGTGLRFRDTYYLWGPFAFSLIFAVTIINAWVRNQKYFRGSEYTSDAQALV